jgi:hypothetical protein
MYLFNSIFSNKKIDFFYAIRALTYIYLLYLKLMANGNQTTLTRIVQSTKNITDKINALDKNSKIFNEKISSQIKSIEIQNEELSDKYIEISETIFMYVKNQEKIKNKLNKLCAFALYFILVFLFIMFAYGIIIYHPSDILTNTTNILNNSFLNLRNLAN